MARQHTTTNLLLNEFAWSPLDIYSSSQHAEGNVPPPVVGVLAYSNHSPGTSTLPRQGIRVVDERHTSYGTHTYMYAK